MVHCVRTYGRRRNVITKIMLVIRIKIESSFLVFQTEKIMPLGTSRFLIYSFLKIEHYTALLVWGLCRSCVYAHTLHIAEHHSL